METEPASNGRLRLTRGASARYASIPITVATRPPVNQSMCRNSRPVRRRPAFSLPATIDQRARPPVTPANRHTRFLPCPASGDEEEAHLRGDVSYFADANLLHDLITDFQIQMPFEDDSHECASWLQALLRVRARQEARLRTAAA